MLASLCFQGTVFPGRSASGSSATILEYPQGISRSRILFDFLQNMPIVYLRFLNKN